MTFFEFLAICRLRENWSPKQIEDAEAIAKSDHPDANIIRAILKYIEQSCEKTDVEKCSLLEKIYIEFIADRDNMPMGEKIAGNRILLQKKTICENCGSLFKYFGDENGNDNDVNKCPKCGTKINRR